MARFVHCSLMDRARFVHCSLRRIAAEDCNGYWQILTSRDPVSKQIEVADLETLRRFVLHPALAPDLLKYDSGIDTSSSLSSDGPTLSSDGPTQVHYDPIDVCIHKEDGSDREYRLLFWNGGDIGQSTAFQLQRIDNSDTESDSSSPESPSEFLIHCKTKPSHTRWQW